MSNSESNIDPAMLIMDVVGGVDTSGYTNANEPDGSSAKEPEKKTEKPVILKKRAQPAPLQQKRPQPKEPPKENPSQLIPRPPTVPVSFRSDVARRFRLAKTAYNIATGRTISSSALLEALLQYGLESFSPDTARMLRNLEAATSGD